MKNVMDLIWEIQRNMQQPDKLFWTRLIFLTGWKVARKLANWIRNTDEWTEFLDKKKSAENHDNDVLVNDIDMTKGLSKRVTAMMMMSPSMATETVKMMKITATMITTTIMTTIVKRKKRKTMMDS
jgi:hypothetical protein